MSEHDGGAPNTAAAAAVHPYLCCVFVILLPGVPGRARSSFCDGPELRHGRTLSKPGFQDLDIWLSRPGFQDLNARFQDLALKTWVSGPQREVSGPDSQDLGFRTSKALHPTVV